MATPLQTLFFALLLGACTSPAPADAGAGTDAPIPPGTDAPIPPGTDAPIPPGTDAPIPPGTDAPIPPGTDGGVLPAPTCDETPLPEPTATASIYVSDCRAGAEAGCVAGDDARPGTSPDAPRRTLAGLDLDGLAAGTHVLFARGGAWDGLRIALSNPRASASAPIVFGAYTPPSGASARPILRAGDGGNGVELGAYSTEPPAPHGGYQLRGLHFDGEGGGNWGMWIRAGATGVVVSDCEIEGFGIGLHIAPETTPAVGISIVRSHIHHNAVHGILGHADDLTIEGNTIEANNLDTPAVESGFNHGIYLGGHGTHLRIRNNLLSRNSVTDGRCVGGNLTIHGHWDDAVLEGNTIVQDASADGCFGFSITPAYNEDSGPEFFTHFVVRANTVVNLGVCAICAGSAPGIVIESNVVFSDRTEYAAAVVIPAIDPGPGDVADGGAILRNNTFYYARSTTTRAVAVARAGSGLVSVSNLITFAGGGGTCFDVASPSQFDVMDHDLCDGDAWTGAHATLAAARAAGLEASGVDEGAALASTPSASNGWDVSLSAGSPAIDAGHPTLSAATDRSCAARTTPDIGAAER